MLPGGPIDYPAVAYRNKHRKIFFLGAHFYLCYACEAYLCSGSTAGRRLEPRIRPGVIALLICVYLNESKLCRIITRNRSYFRRQSHRISSSLVSPHLLLLSSLLRMSLSMFVSSCHVVFVCHIVHPSLPTDYRQPSHAVHLFCIRRRPSESQPLFLS